MRTLHVIDSHTGGEPTRVVLDGFPDLGRGNLAERRARCRDQFDHWRRALLAEPRGHEVMVGAVLVPADAAEACCGVIFCNHVGYLGMCGHGAIGVIRTLAHIGRIGPGRHRLQTPAGDVDCELGTDGTVAIDNVDSWRSNAGVVVDVPGYGRVRGDVAWGGNWFFISGDSPLPLEYIHRAALLDYTSAVLDALHAAGVRGDHGAAIDHVELHAASPTAGIDARVFVLCPGRVWDRSPCGTGTSARIACLAADDRLAAGQRWRQESIIGSVFEASFAAGVRGIRPRIVGRAHVTAEARLLLAADDPFAWGLDPPVSSLASVPQTGVTA
jgi:4-hydroxyproline epimerase